MSNFAAGPRVGNTKQRNKKIGQKGRGLGHETYIEFWEPVLSPVRMKLQKSNFAGGLRLRGTKQRNKNGQSGHCLWYVTRCCCLEPISITANTINDSELSLLTSWTKKGKNYF